MKSRPLKKRGDFQYYIKWEKFQKICWRYSGQKPIHVVNEVGARLGTDKKIKASNLLKDTLDYGAKLVNESEAREKFPNLFI